MDYFATIESAQEYLGKLCDVLQESCSALDTELASGLPTSRRIKGLLVARHQMDQANDHLKKSQVLLNNLRRLEKVLCHH